MYTEMSCSEQERLERAWSDAVGQLFEATQRKFTENCRSEPLKVVEIGRLQAIANQARTEFYQHRQEHGC
jgi:hypothetical protein